MTSQPRQADLDYLARGLYHRYLLCRACGGAMTFADALQFRCPHCGAVYLPGPDITPERGREMLATLEARRVELGLI